MNHGALTESLTEPSLSYHRVTPDRKGREGKGIGREALEHASLTYWSEPRPVDNPSAVSAARRPPVGCKSEIQRWFR